MNRLKQQYQIGTPLKGWRLWVGVLVSFVCLIWLIYSTDWVEVWTALSQTNYWLVLFAAGLNLASIPLRTARWRVMFPPHNSPPFGKLTAVMLIGQAINIIFPARLGDLVRATLVGTERIAYVIGTLVVQSALDLLMLAGLVIVLLFQVTLPVGWRKSGHMLLLMTVAVLLIVIGLVIGRGLMRHILTKVIKKWPYFSGQPLLSIMEQFLNSLEILRHPRVFILVLIWSLLIWSVYGSVNYVLLQAIGAQPSWLIAIFVLVVLQLGVAVPSVPGRVGVFHYLSIQALAVFGILGAGAVSYAIILHLIAVVLPIIMGGGVAWKMGIYLTSTPQKLET